MWMNTVAEYSIRKLFKSEPEKNTALLLQAVGPHRYSRKGDRGNV